MTCENCVSAFDFTHVAPFCRLLVVILFILLLLLHPPGGSNSIDQLFRQNVCLCLFKYLLVCVCLCFLKLFNIFSRKICLLKVCLPMRFACFFSYHFFSSLGSVCLCVTLSLKSIVFSALDITGLGLCCFFYVLSTHYSHSLSGIFSSLLCFLASFLVTVILESLNYFYH